MSKLSQAAKYEDKYQRALKLLEFMTLYNFKKSEHRNICPLNIMSEINIRKDKADPPSKEKFNEYADLLAEVNADLRIESHQNDRVNKMKEKQQNLLASQTSPMKLIQNNEKTEKTEKIQLRPAQKVQPKQKTEAKQQQSPPNFKVDDQNVDLDDIPGYQSSIQQNKQQMPAIKQESEELDSKKLEKSNASITSHKSMRNHNSPPSPSEPQPLKKKISEHIPQTKTKNKSKFIEQSGDIQSERSYKQGKVSKKYFESEYSDIARENPPKSQKSNILKVSNIYVKDQQINASRALTERELISTLKQTITDHQKFELLLKLEDFDLKQEYYFKRLNDRMNTPSSTIKKMKSITWESLKMPTLKFEHKKFNFAHVIE